MKIALIVLACILLLFVVTQLWANSQVNGIEEYPYAVIQDFGEFEVRDYQAANFIYVTMEATSYAESSSKGFTTLAGYIFGGNADRQEIAMTSPVELEMGDSITMKFMVPNEYNIESLPTPNDAKVHFKTEAKRKMAAITFSGFANDKRILDYKESLFSLLSEAGIEHIGSWSFLGYDPPFKATNRRNEVVVELLE